MRLRGTLGTQNSDDNYVVTVTATDPFGTPTARGATNSVTITVTITVTDVDEAPSVADRSHHDKPCRECHRVRRRPV